MKKVKLFYKGSRGIQIPLLRSKKRGVNFPLRDYVKGGNLPESMQYAEMDENEAKDLMRAWPKNFYIITSKIESKKNKEIDTKEVSNGDNRL